MNFSIEQIDAALVEAGWPEMSPWWWDTINQVYRTDHRNIVIRGGRRGGKSSTLAGRVAPFEVLADHHIVPPGDIGYFAIISADKEQAQERLDTCHKALKVLGVSHRYTANEITLTNKNVGIKCFAATTSAVVSFTCIGFLCDEMSRWRDKDSKANPAHEIVSALRPTMATMPHARGWYVSAPFSTLDLHHEMVSRGTNESQMVFIGTTPQMNPTLTDAMILRLEPDEPTRQREYYVIPMSSDATKFFSNEFIEAARVPRLGFSYVDRCTAGGDWAFRRDHSAVVVLEKDPEGHTRVSAWAERIPGLQALKPSKTIRELSQVAIEAGADSIACDMHYIDTASEVLETLQIELLQYPVHENDKWYVRLRVMLADGTVDLSRAPLELITQLKGATSRPLASGTIKIELERNGDGHGDYVSALVNAIWATTRPRPEKKMTMNVRRFPRGGFDVPNPMEMRDYPPED